MGREVFLLLYEEALFSYSMLLRPGIVRKLRAPASNLDLYFIWIHMDLSGRIQRFPKLTNDFLTLTLRITNYLLNFLSPEPSRIITSSPKISRHK